MIDSASWTVTAGDLVAECFASVSLDPGVVLWPDGILRRHVHGSSLNGVRCVARARNGSRCQNELYFTGGTGVVKLGGISCQVVEFTGMADGGDWETQLCRVHADRPGVETVCQPEREPYEFRAADAEEMKFLIAHASLAAVPQG